MENWSLSAKDDGMVRHLEQLEAELAASKAIPEILSTEATQSCFPVSGSKSHLKNDQATRLFFQKQKKMVYKQHNAS